MPLTYRDFKRESTNDTSSSELLISPPRVNAKSRPLKIPKTKDLIQLKKKIPKGRRKEKLSKPPPKRETIPKQKIKPKIVSNETVTVNILDSRDHLWMQNAHIIHFIDTNGHPIGNIGKELMNQKLYCKPNNFKGTIGNILVTKKGKKHIFSMILKKAIRSKRQILCEHLKN